MYGLARVLFIQKRFAEASAVLEEGATGMRVAGELMLRSMILLTLAWTLITTGDIARAEKAVDEALGALVALQHYEVLARAFEAETALSLKAGNDAPPSCSGWPTASASRWARVSGRRTKIFTTSWNPNSGRCSVRKRSRPRSPKAY